MQSFGHVDFGSGRKTTKELIHDLSPLVVIVHGLCFASWQGCPNQRYFGFQFRHPHQPERRLQSIRADVWKQDWQHILSLHRLVGAGDGRACPGGEAI